MCNVLVITKETTLFGKEKKRQEALSIYPGASVTVICSETKSSRKQIKKYKAQNPKHKILDL